MGGGGIKKGGATPTQDISGRCGVAPLSHQHRDDARRAIAEKFDAIACEMEGGAVAQVCAVNGVDFAVLRVISDSEEGDYETFAEKAAANSARIICGYLKK